jgi:hypothetical protein
MKDLPEMLQPSVEAAYAPPEIEVVETTTDAIKPTCVFVTISLPVQSECQSKSFQDEAARCDLRKINRERMAKIHALRRGLTTTNSRLSDGSLLRTNSDVLYYILDQISIPS